MEPQSIFGALIALAVLVLLFLLVRNLVHWYWRIDEFIDLQKNQLKVLKEIKVILEQQSSR